MILKKLSIRNTSFKDAKIPPKKRATKTMYQSNEVPLFSNCGAICFKLYEDFVCVALFTGMALDWLV